MLVCKRWIGKHKNPKTLTFPYYWDICELWLVAFGFAQCKMLGPLLDLLYDFYWIFGMQIYWTAQKKLLDIQYKSNVAENLHFLSTCNMLSPWC